MVQPIDFGQFYNPIYLLLSLIGVGSIVALIYYFGLNTVFAKKDKTKRNKRLAKKPTTSSSNKKK